MILPEKKIRSLILAVVFLIITNVVLLLFLLFGRNESAKPKAGRLNMVGTFLQDSLGFDKKQMDLYQNLRKADYEKGKPVFDNLKAARESFYKNIYSDSSADSLINIQAAIVAQKQTAVDEHMLQHFKNLRSLCTAAQLPRFDSSFKKVVEKVTEGRFSRGGGHH